MKPVRLYVVLALCICLMAGVVLAAEKPNRRVEITVINGPNEPYYLDIIVAGQSGGATFFEGSLDASILATLLGLRTESEYPALTYHHSQLRGDLRGEPGPKGRVYTFTTLGLSDAYHIIEATGIPGTFKIVLAAADGTVHVTEPIKVPLYQTKITYDWASGRVMRQSTVLTLMYIYAMLLLPQLMLEIAALPLFKLPVCKNIPPLLIINVVSALALTATVGWTLAARGNSWAVIELPLVQAWLIFLETVACVKLLGDVGFWRKVGFAAAGNAAAWLVISRAIDKIMGYVAA